MWRRCEVLLLMAACGGEPCPDACAEARRATADCLAAEGLDWTARGWSDADDFDAWCATWVWEAGRLERGGTDAACHEAEDLPRADCAVVLTWPESSAGGR